MSEVITNADGVERNDPEKVVDLRSELSREIILVEGDVDLATAPRLHARLSAAFNGVVEEVVVDLTKVSFIDSTGLGVLVNARQKARSVGARLRLILPEGRA